MKQLIGSVMLCILSLAITTFVFIAVGWKAVVCGLLLSTYIVVAFTLLENK